MNNLEVEGSKSPKSPKLSEEVSELTIKSPLSTENEENEEGEEEGEEVVNDNTSEDNQVLKGIIKEIIQNCPAGQVETVGSICTELFGKTLEGLIEEETKTKLIQDNGFEITESEVEQIEEEEGDLNESSEPSEANEFAMGLKSKLDEYVKDLYPGTGTLSIQQSQVDPTEWTIHILGQKLKPKAFWSGHWHSHWTVNFKEGGSEGKTETEGDSLTFALNGKVELTVHYHEEGSVQLSAEKEIQSRVDFKADSLPQCITKIFWKIKDSEDAVQLALNEAYQQLAENIFKKLRRQLPVTRTKMDWGKFSNYQLRSELKK